MEKIHFELSAKDAETIASWIPEIISNGISTADAPAFKRLRKALLTPTVEVKNPSSQTDND